MDFSTIERFQREYDAEMRVYCMSGRRVMVIIVPHGPEGEQLRLSFSGSLEDGLKQAISDYVKSSLLAKGFPDNAAELGASVAVQ